METKTLLRDLCDNGELSTRTINCLEQKFLPFLPGFSYLEELTQFTETDIAGIRSLGDACLNEIKSSMTKRGLSFKEGAPVRNTSMNVVLDRMMMKAVQTNLLQILSENGFEATKYNVLTLMTEETLDQLEQSFDNFIKTELRKIVINNSEKLDQWKD